MSDTKLTFPGSSAFHADLKNRVDAYFTRTGTSRAANGAMRWKTVFWLALAAATWALVAFGPLSFPLALVAWGLLGFTMASIGFNVGHDAIHLSWSKTPWVNQALGRTFDVLGGASKTWARSHNIVHHTYTNIPGLDGDLDPGPWMRFAPQDKPPHFLHRFQFIYAWALYGFTSLVWVFKKDFVQLVEHKARPRTIVDVLGFKAVHFALFLGVPLLFSGLAVWQVLVAYVLMLAVSGVTLAVVFQLAHVVEGVQFPLPGPDGTMAEPWAENVMRTTANFGRTPVTTFFTGGLDHQIEHHLFPRICHIHYPALSPIVEQCARDHGLPYLHSGSFVSALGSHTRMLKRLGRGRVPMHAVPAAAAPAGAMAAAAG